MNNCPLGKCQNINCENYTDCLAENRLLNSRAIATETIIKNQRKMDRNQEITGTYIGYDQATKSHLIDCQGSILPAKDSSIISFRHPGQIVSVYIPHKSSSGFIS